MHSLFILAHLFLATDTLHNRFVPLSARSTSSIIFHFGRHHQLVLTHLDNNDHDELEDEDEYQEAYRNRSLVWTNKYRHLIPYEKARRAVMDMGFTCKEDWDEYVADGKKYHGPYLPNHPDEMYKEDWVSWDDFLGLMRSYNDTREMVRMVLKLQTLEEYTKFILDNPSRAHGLRIPFKPDIVYRGTGWQGEDHFFGTME